MTNAEKIRLMSDEELAEFIKNVTCTVSTEYWLDWLKEEATGNGW